MAKSPSFFGLRRGSTKSLTFQVLNGRQVTKDRVYDVKNPRTFSQMQQRMVMATAAAAYAGMREIVDHSFEGYTYGQPTMSEFIRLNAKMLREGLTDNTCIYNPYKDRGALPNPYIVSKGTLTNNIVHSISDIDESQVFHYIKYPYVPLNAITGNDFIKMLGIPVNGYITLICLAYSPETNIHQFGYVRLTPNKDELDHLMSDLKVVELFDIESNVPLFGIYEGFGTESFPIVFDFDQGGIMLASSAIVISDKKISWKRSSDSMKVFTKPPYNPPIPTETLATYPVGTGYILNGGTI